MPTIKEIADATGRGKSTVMRAVKELGLRDTGHAKAEGARGALIIDAEGASMLADYLTKNVEPKQSAQDSETEPQPHIDIDAIVTVYRERIDDLKAQIESLNAQLETKDEQIKQLNLALEHEQEATKEAQDESRRSHDRVVLMASAGVWERLTGYKGLLESGD